MTEAASAEVASPFGDFRGTVSRIRGRKLGCSSGILPTRRQLTLTGDDSGDSDAGEGELRREEGGKCPREGRTKDVVRTR